MDGRREWIRVVAALASAATLPMMTGCKPDAAIKNPAVIGRGVKETAGPPATEPQTASGEVPNLRRPGSEAASGRVSGTILFKGTAPARTIDTSMDPACSLGGPPTLPTEQFAVRGGRLGNVFVYVKSGPPEAMQAAGPAGPPVVLDQVHCRYTPHVIALMQGGYVQFRNSDPTMHNIHTVPKDLGNETIDVSEGPRGQPQTKQFAHAETMIPVRCNNHPWMNAFVNVSPTPFFAVSDADGRFELKGLPAGVYTILAVHEKMGEKTMQVTVPAGGAARADFSFAL